MSWEMKLVSVIFSCDERGNQELECPHKVRKYGPWVKKVESLNA